MLQQVQSISTQRLELGGSELIYIQHGDGFQPAQGAQEET
jgi:hypothetical protein